MSWTDDFLTGVAVKLAAIGAGTWSPAGTGGSIFQGALPATPNNATGVTGYNLRPDVALADVVQPVQFWIRGDAAFVRTTADLLFDNLHGVEALVIGGIHCPLISQHSDVPQGPDGSGRLQRAVNYDFFAMRPTASRPD